MGWFASGAASKAGHGLSTALLHRLECRACPLDKVRDNLHPHMPATGSKRPVIYILGEAPGEQEDEEGAQFVGPSGRLLRPYIPGDWIDDIRWNNVVRTRPPNNRDPSAVEIECCRPSVIRDIEDTKPRAIFCFGGTALSWLTSMTRITDWRGRRLPVRVGSHTCWCYVFVHPAAILHLKNARQTQYSGIDLERVLERDLERAFAEVESLPEPEVHDRASVDHGVEIFTGKPGDLAKLEQAFRWAARQDAVGVDYETNNLRPYAAGAKILTASIGTGERSFAFALRHRQSRWPPSELRRVEELLVEFILSPVRKAVHFLRFELEWTGYFYGWDLVHAPNWHGTESQASVLDERTSGDDDNKARGKSGEGGPFSLKFLVRQYFGFDLKALSDQLNKADLDNEPLEDVLWYNAGDSKYHCFLFLAQEQRLEAAGFMHLYHELLDRVPTTVLTQLQGVPLNLAVSDRLAEKLTDQIDDIMEAIHDDPDIVEFEREAHRKFKPLSDADCVTLFRDQLRCKEGYRGDDRYSADEDVLEKIDIPIARLIISLRKADKKLSTYVYRNIPEKGKLIVWPDGKLHPNFNTVRVRTRRLCIREGTKVTIPGGYKNIEDIRAGDLVYTFDADARLTLKKVRWAGFTGRKRCVRIHWSGGKDNRGFLDATPDHLIRVLDGHYVAAKDLKVGVPNSGRQGRYRDGEHVLALHRRRAGRNYLHYLRAAWEKRKQRLCNHMIERIEALPGYHRVYDIEVEETHNFIANELCVHNSCDDPNVQNIPKRIEKDKEARELREQIEAPPGHVIVSVDYGQIQARGIAIESRDANFCKALWERYDVHGHWAKRLATAYPSRIGGREYLNDEKVMKEFRNDPIKSGWTFGLFFGSRLETAAEYCKIPVEVLRPEFREFKREFAGVFEWHERMQRFYEEHGYVEDSFGFRYNAPLSFNQVINSPIQGLEALFVMRAMGNLSKLAYERDDYYYQPHAQIHDDLMFILPSKRVDLYVEDIVTEMLDIKFPFLNVPIVTEVTMGPNLKQMERILEAASDTWGE